jgi:DNA polymerase III gamma/tau subunit
LLNHFRNLLLFLVSGSEAGLLNVSEAEMGALTRQAKHIDADALTRVMEVLSAAEGRQREVASKRIFMEVTLLKVIQAREATSLDAVLKQLKAMRDQVPAGPAVAVPAASAMKVNSVAPVVPPAPRGYPYRSGPYSGVPAGQPAVAETSSGVGSVSGSSRQPAGRRCLFAPDSEWTGQIAVRFGPVAVGEFPDDRGDLASIDGAIASQ